MRSYAKCWCRFWGQRLERERFSGSRLEPLCSRDVVHLEQYRRAKDFWPDCLSVAVNDLERRMLFAEVKLNKVNITQLRAKARNILAAHPGYDAEFQGLSLEDME